MSGANGRARRRATQVLDGAAATRHASCSPRTRTPTATRSARWSRCTGCCTRSARTRHVHGRRRVPAALRVPLLRRSTAWSPRRPPTSPSARSSSSTAATSTATRSSVAQARRRAHPQHRPPPRQHPLRHRQPRRARRLLHGRDRLGPHARSSGVELDADDRRGALRRAGHRHRPLHVREHRRRART